MKKKKILNYMSTPEIAFGKLGYHRKEKGGLIVYYRPYDQEDIHIDDITFMKDLKKIVLYQGSELGSDAYRMDCEVMNAIILQMIELGWYDEVINKELCKKYEIKEEVNEDER